MDMKKLIVVLLILAFTGGTFARAMEIDWSSMTDKEILFAIGAAQAELDRRNGTESAAETEAEVKKVTVPIGVWVVGEDIPVGHWTITVAPGQQMQWGVVSYGMKLDELGKNIEYVLGEPYYWEMIKIEGSAASVSLTEIDLDMQEGAYVVIEECDMIFTPYQGKQKLDF